MNIVVRIYIQGRYHQGRNIVVRIFQHSALDEDAEPEDTVCMERWAHDLMQRESMIVVRGSGLRQLCLTSCLAGTDNPRDTVFFHGYI